MLNCLCTVSIKNTVANFSFSFYQEYCTLEIFKADIFFVLSLLKILFSIFQKNSIFNRKKSPWKVKCTVRLIESTEYFRPKWVMISMKDIHLLPPYYLVYTRAKNYVQDNYIFTWRCDPFKLKYTFFRSVVEPVISYFCIF